MDEQLANALESAVKHTVQKLTLWRAAQLQLEIYQEGRARLFDQKHSRGGKEPRIQ
jgi:hypothetical protein